MNDLTIYLELRSEIDRLKRQVKKLQKENSGLRGLCGRKKRNEKKVRCIENYRPGMSGVELAKLAKCTPAYANRIIQSLRELGLE